MKHKVDLNRRLVASFAAIAMSLSLVVPAAFPAFASADTLDSRSITMSSSKPSATGVSYDVQFTAKSAIDVGGGLVIDFCSNSPIIGISCDTTSGTVPSATSATLGAVTYDGSAAGSAGSISATATNIKWTAATAVSIGTVVNITLTGITNPSGVTVGGASPTTGTFYARMTTYVAANLSGYTSPTSVGTYADSGGVAMTTNNDIGVTAYVQESLYFCVSHTILTKGCTGADNPSLILGEDQGNGVKALDATKLSTGLDYAQIGTNAAHGAIVNLQTDTLGCGGLVRPGGGNCDITAASGASATTAAAMIGSGKFGLIIGPGVPSTDGTSYGSLRIAPSTNYSSTDYFLNYITGDATGVTSTYGSPLFDTNGTAVANMNMPITFGVSPQPQTPAGIYKADLNLIATGTF